MTPASNKRSGADKLNEAMEDTARVIVEVVAGLLPGKNPNPELTHRWAITSTQWYGCEDRTALLAECNDKALEYAKSLMMRPDLLNWVRLDWIWL